MVTLLDGRGGKKEQLVRVAYPCRHEICVTCGGFGHTKCSTKTWTMIARGLVLEIRVEPIISLPAMLAAGNSNLLSSLKEREDDDGMWHKIPRLKVARLESNSQDTLESVVVMQKIVRRSTLVEHWRRKHQLARTLITLKMSLI